ncbi:hypothetical protein [Cryobacterium sp. HLT2-28]|uniref:hypothetical protein n=1 Tax=Cryobacterium sp. HLT2-28 TaxID=1259146 RepID=UPI00106C3ADC|nr:hypothetical protein [Cryobacterium sp. HLT2-28]TFB97532.1 hypothetical protein E3O48_02460 [Cryobacterium sp. HLT2-28]
MGAVSLNPDAITPHEETPRSEALNRAMTRDAGTRFEPLAATDNVGRYTGLVRLERLVQV